MSGEVAKRDALKRPAEVEEYMENLVREVKNKSPAGLFLHDAENLIHGSGMLALTLLSQWHQVWAISMLVSSFCWRCRYVRAYHSQCACASNGSRELHHSY